MARALIDMFLPQSDADLQLWNGRFIPESPRRATGCSASSPAVMAAAFWKFNLPSGLANCGVDAEPTASVGHDREGGKRVLWRQCYISVSTKRLLVRELNLPPPRPIACPTLTWILESGVGARSYEVDDE